MFHGDAAVADTISEDVKEGMAFTVYLSSLLLQERLASWNWLLVERLRWIYDLISVSPILTKTLMAILFHLFQQLLLLQLANHTVFRWWWRCMRYYGKLDLMLWKRVPKRPPGTVCVIKIQSLLATSKSTFMTPILCWSF